MTWPSTPGPTNYQHPFPNYQLNDIHQAMDYNSAGQPVLRVITAPGSGVGNAAVNSNAGIDAFGRLRVSNPVTLFDTQNRYLDGGYFSSSVSGSGTYTYNQNGSNFSLAVTNAANDEVIAQSKTVQLYQPGKSLLVMNTFCMAALQDNLRQRVGYFTSGNGVFFEADGEDLYLVIRSSVNGTVAENRIAQTDWNQDPLNGSGGSGLTLNPATVQIFWCDIEWLGVGSVRCGFVINGIFYLAHVFNHANDDTNVYMTTASLNCRYEIKNTGATAGTSTMLQICSTVISEGGYTPKPPLYYADNGVNVANVASSSSLYHLCTIRLNSAFIDSVVIPSQVDLLTTSVRYGQFQLIKNASIANTSYSNVAGSVVQSSTAGDTITGGTVVYSGLFSSRAEVNISEDIRNRLQLGRTVGNVSDTITLAVQYTQNNADTLFKFAWTEDSH